jgi:tripeptidyl-peptidase-1
MNTKVCILLAVFAVLAVLASASSRVVKGRADESYFRTGSGKMWHHHGRAKPQEHVRLIFAVKQNMEAVHAVLAEVSNPKSALYGKYLSLSEVGEVAASHESHEQVVSFLLGQGIIDLDSTQNKEFVVANMNVAQAERLLDTEYHAFTEGHAGRRILRTPSYSLPAHIAEHVDFVSHTVQFPQKRPHFFKHGPATTATAGTTSPKTLYTYYQIDDSIATNDATTQSVYENLGQSYGAQFPSFFLWSFVETKKIAEDDKHPQASFGVDVAKCHSYSDGV